METSVERLDDGLVRLTVSVLADDVDEAIQDAYRRVSSELKIPGFRKGKVPPRVVDNYVGKEKVLAEAQEALVNETYAKAIDIEALRPIDTPDMGELDLPQEGADYSYEAEVPTRPELTLSSYEGIRVSAPSAEVTEEDIDAKIDEIRDRFATLEVTEEGVDENGFILVSFTGLIGGEPYEGDTVDKFLYEMGRKQMPEDFERQLVGAKAGDRLEIVFTIPETSSRPEFVGKEATFDVEVHEVKRKVLPDVDDDFVTQAGYDSVDEMREKTRERLDAEKKMNRAHTIELEARRALAENLEGEIPEVMIRKRVNDIIRDFFNSLESQGISPEQYTAARNLSLEDLNKQFEKEGEDSIRGELALESLFKALDMEVTDEHIDQEISDFVSSGGSVEETRKKFESSGIMPVIHEQSMQRQATKWLLDNIEIDEIEEEEDA